MKNIKPYLLLGCSLFFAAFSNAQSGCTDPAATNYNASATTNDGSCVYPVTHNTPVYRCDLNSSCKESSALVWTDNKLWTINDSGNPANLYSVDTNTGTVLQKVVIDNYANNDWEALAADSAFIYIGDHGNNNGNRTNLKILKIAKADIGSATVVHVNAQAIFFSYADQTSLSSSSTNNFDCEAMLSLKDSLYLFTKDRGDLKTRVYKLPKVPGTYSAAPYTTYNVSGLITDASYSSTTGEVLLAGYQPGAVNSFLWFLNDYKGVDFFSGNKRRIEIGDGGDWQTEGITYISPYRYFISNESSGPHTQALFTGARPLVPAAIEEYGNKTALATYPSPVTDVLHIDNATAGMSYTIRNAIGQAIVSGALAQKDNTVNTADLQPGIYLAVITAVDGGKTTIRFVKW
ncbi:MAG: T9SS type A sorting domain-containing protein [Taibaiella sp.]|nr:T9SS type A sorting domain-containing protein [Taibaiella sp.]